MTHPSPLPEYEVTLLLIPSLSEKETQEYFEKVLQEKFVEEGGTISVRDFWGKQVLAYPIRKEEAAWYMTFRATLPKEKLAEIDEEIRLDGKILRHLIVKTEKDEIFMTLEEIKKWNNTHLAKDEKEEEDDILPTRKKTPSPRSEQKEVEDSSEKTKEVKKPSSSEKQVSKDEIDRKIDEILGGDLDL
ncbi:30S ribosomal protein S6 [Candidatus Peregrinibacteria bacterium]|nr:MAG: 30S ribosomal protein S6 [Candidatus Peregrinibacteria bacterium]